MKKFFLLSLAAFFFCAPVFSADSSVDPKTENIFPKEQEYEGRVAVIDHETGSLGIVIQNLETGAEDKKAFQVDLNEAVVLNAQGNFLEFSDIQPGDDLIIYSILEESGKETITEIYDSSRQPQD